MIPPRGLPGLLEATFALGTAGKPAYRAESSPGFRCFKSIYGGYNNVEKLNFKKAADFDLLGTVG